MSTVVEAEYRTYEYGLTLHNACLHGDEAAFDTLARAYVPAIVKQLRRSFHGEWNQEHIHSAVIDALMNYIQRPEQYKPELRKSLYSYLLMAAQGDLKNLLRKEIDRNHRTASLDAVDNWDGEPEYDLSERQFSDGFDVEEFVIEGESLVWRKIATIFADARDRQCAYYILAEVRDTDAFVAIYDLHHLPPKEQEHVVKKHKDRIKKRMARNLDPEEFRGYD